MPDQDADLLGSIIERAQKRTPDHLEDRMREADQIKAREEADSQRRLDKMWQQEHARQRAIAEKQAEQRRREQMVLRYVLLGAAILILVILLLLLLLSQGGAGAASRSLPFAVYV